MLVTSKPKQKMSLPIRGFAKSGERIKKTDTPVPMRLKVRK